MIINSELNLLQQKAFQGYCQDSLFESREDLIGVMEEVSQQTQMIFSIFDLKNFHYVYFTSNLYDMYGLKPEDGYSFDKSFSPNTMQYEGIAIFMNMMKEAMRELEEEQLKDCSINLCGMPLVNGRNQSLRLFIHAVPISFRDEDGYYPRYWLSRLRDVTAFVHEGCWLRAKIVHETYHQAYGQLEVQSRDILTPTQLDVLKLWAKGLDIEQISNRTLASRGTVRNQFTALRARLLARDNSAAVQLAIDCGMLDPSYKG